MPLDPDLLSAAAASGVRPMVDLAGRALAAHLTGNASAANDLAPSLPDGHGSALPLFAWRAPPRGLPEAFALPVQWKRSTVELRQAGGLPSGLAEVAAAVVEDLGLESRWHLQLASDLGGIDLSAFSVDAPSAWAPLAASLVVASEGGRPRPHVFATGAWRGSGIEGVGAIPAKAEAVGRLAAHLPERKPPVLFVPASNFEVAREAAAGAVEVLAYPAGDPDPRRSLSQHLARLGAPPSRTDPFDARASYANDYRRRLPAEEWRGYYLEALVEELSERVRRRSRPHAAAPVARLAIALSMSWELAALLLATLKPARALVFASGETSFLYTSLAKKAPPGTLLELLRFDRSPESAVSRIRSWLDAEVPPGSAFVDVTGGTTIMKLVLARAAQLARATTLVLNHDWRAGYAVVGTERIATISWMRELE